MPVTGTFFHSAPVFRLLVWYTGNTLSLSDKLCSEGLIFGSGCTLLYIYIYVARQCRSCHARPTLNGTCVRPSCSPPPSLPLPNFLTWAFVCLLFILTPKYIYICIYIYVYIYIYIYIYIHTKSATALAASNPSCSDFCLRSHSFKKALNFST